MKPNAIRNQVTASDVAALAGVSRWTVNRAFKKEASISANSRKKVLAAAQQLGYSPDLIASSLASDRSNLVSLLIDDFSNPHKLILMETITRILRENGWGTLLVNTLDEDDAASALLSAKQRRVDAAVLIGSNFNESLLAAADQTNQIRTLIAFARYSVYPGTLSICCDDQLAMEDIAEHVISRGYRHPVFIAGPQTRTAHLLRKETFFRRWMESHDKFPPYIAVDTYDPQLAYQKVVAYLLARSRKQWPDILVCENDALAMGAIDAARHEFGLKVPDDIAITGFDDVPLAANPNYRLTTYRQPISAMAEGLVSVLQGEHPLPTLSQYEGSLVIREST